MKSISIFFASLLLLLTLNESSADEFSQHSVTLENIACKELDFGSNFRAARSKQNILKTNPELNMPNFGGKYLLIKNELMLETEWLIADCATGKFLKERMYGLAQFKPDSLLVILFPDLSKDKNSDDTEEVLPELKLWKDHQWETITTKKVSSPIPVTAVKIENPISTATDKAINSLQQYESLFNHYPATVEELNCKDLDYKSLFKVQNSKANIERENKSLNKPNFAGKYLLVKNQHLFESSWFLVDCATGKFFADSIAADHLNFKSDSTLVIITTKKTPKLMQLVGQEWKRIPNPLLDKSKKELNKIFGIDAEELLSALPNPSKKSMIIFENLECKKIEGIDLCTVDIDKKIAEKIPAEKTQLVLAIINKWGNKQKISNGKCSSERKPVTCSIEIE